MKKFVSIVFAALFAFASLNVVAAGDKKPSAEDCKKDPKMKGCEAKKK